MPTHLTSDQLIAQAESAAPVVLQGFLHVLAAVLILVVGVWLSGKVEDYTRRLLARSRRFDDMLQGFFGNIARYFVLTITGLTVLSEFGVQTTSLVAVIGAASLAIGLALQGTLSNLAAGVMLLIFRPFRLGHHVQIGGSDGTVRDLTLFWTEIVTDANTQILIPNSSVWGQALRNMSIYPQPAARLAVRFPLKGEVEMATISARLLPLLAGLPQVAKEPAPQVLFDRATTDNALVLFMKFTPNGDNDIARSAVIEAVEAALQTPPAV